MSDELLYATAKTHAAITGKGERTRARILEAALDLCREHGYEKTTMRAVAKAAGVSLGSAYYYFQSKEHLIQAFYAQTHSEHLEVCMPLLADEKSFRRRLEIVLQTKIDTSTPYHHFAGVLFRTAADPESPLNPFSDASAPLREESTGLFARVIEDSDLRPGKLLRPHLPRLLWTYQMGVILFWIHDRSADCKRTRMLIQTTTKLVGQLVRIAGLPPLRPVLRSVLGLLDDLSEPDDAPSAHRT